MSESFLTKCPHCTASFRVKEEHLNAAGGKVRCGACMKVFNANEHLERPEGEVENPTFEKEATVSEASTSAESEPAVSQEEEAFFADDPDEDAREETYSGDVEFDESFLNLDSDSLGDTHFIDAVEDEQQGAESDESWAEKMLEELDESREPTPPAEHEYFEQKSAPGKPQADTRKPLEELPGIDEIGSPDHPEHIEDEPDDLVDLSASPYDGLRPEPIPYHAKPDRTALKNFAWGLFSLLLLAGLAAQITWFHLDRFSQIPQLRPALAILCEHTACELPPLVNVKLIEAENVIVRSHPVQPKALIVDAVIINNASFEQPFPSLALSFSDLNNNIVAERVFSPTEYLQQEAGTFDLMPAETPIQIALEILDPGKDAVNYDLSFVSLP